MTARVLLAAAILAGTLVLAGTSDVSAQRQPGWEVRVPDRMELPVGASGTLAISLALDRGLTVSRDAPVIVDLEAAKGVTVRRRRLGREDAVDPGADAPRFAIPVRGDAPGEHAVAVRLRFWLCGSKICRPIDLRRTTTIVVAPTPDPADKEPQGHGPHR